MKASFLLLYKVPYKEGKTCFLCYLLSLHRIGVGLGSEGLHSTQLHHSCWSWQFCSKACKYRQSAWSNLIPKQVYKSCPCKIIKETPGVVLFFFPFENLILVMRNRKVSSKNWLHSQRQ